MFANVLTFISADTTAALNETLFILPNWKWLGLAAAIVVSIFLLLLLGPIFSAVSSVFQKKVHKNTFLFFLLKESIHSAAAWIISGLLMLSAIELLQLPDGFTKVLRGLTQLVLAINGIRLAYMFVNAMGERLEVFVKKTESTLDDQLAPFATKTLKVFVIVMGILIMLQSFGLNVVSLLAGLGLGGLALALAAQDTVANLFGSITIILDRPFQVGDYVKVTDTEGTVEEVGFRSTRIRTFYQSLVSIPNSIMAKEKIDNMGVRPRRRIRHMIGITYDANRSQIEDFISRVRSSLKQNKNVFQDDITVAFQSYGDSTINVLVNCFALASDLTTELQVQQDILFDIMQATKEAGVEFAFPTQTLYLKGLNNTDSENNKRTTAPNKSTNAFS